MQVEDLLERIRNCDPLKVPAVMQLAEEAETLMPALKEAEQERLAAAVLALTNRAINWT
ncbi:MAG: hypothetical protein MI806_34200 [Minwuiales bacterium]|nr:hypothetical protein [Minwuiales bacterium]